MEDEPWHPLLASAQNRAAAAAAGSSISSCGRPIDSVVFRVQDVGERGGVERVAGGAPGGRWDTAKWLVEKTHAHIEGDRLVAELR